MLGKVHSSCLSPRKTSERSAINNDITWSLPLHNPHTSSLLRNSRLAPFAVSQEHITNHVSKMIQRIFWKVIQPSCWLSLFKIPVLLHYENDKCCYHLIKPWSFSGASCRSTCAFYTSWMSKTSSSKFDSLAETEGDYSFADSRSKFFFRYANGKYFLRLQFQ